MRTSFAIAFVALAACGGAQTTGTQSPGGGSGSGSAKPGAPGDDMLEIAVDVKGVQLEPEALGRPGVVKVDPKGQKAPPTDKKLDAQIAKQRDAMTKAKDPVEKQAYAALLATSLWRKSNEASGADKNAALADARQALRDVAQVVGAKVDPTTLQMLGSYELMVDPPDWGAAEKAFAEFVAKSPKDPQEPYYRAWWTLCLLRQYKNDEALDVVKAVSPSEKQPELAYAMAWAKWRKGDGAGAWQAILAASKGWGNLANREVVDRDTLLIAARGGVPWTDAFAKIGPMFGKAAENQYAMLFKLGDGLSFAGRWADAVAAFEKALDIIGAKAPATEVTTLRYREADFTVRLDNPAESARFGKLALDALAKCGAKCTPADALTVVKAVFQIGKVFHVLYASAHDDRFYQPALDLYLAAIGLMGNAPQDDKDEAVKTMNQLQSTKKMVDKGRSEKKDDPGNHDAKYVGALLQYHNQEVQACYEAQLAGDPKLAGTLTLNLESDETGVIKGKSTEPKAGLAGVAAVGQCVETRASAWKLPTKAKKGATRIKIVYTLAKRPGKTP